MPCKGRSSASGVGEFLCAGASGAAMSLSCSRYVPLNWSQKRKKKAIRSKPESLCGSLRIPTSLIPYDCKGLARIYNAREIREEAEEAAVETQQILCKIIRIGHNLKGVN